MKNYVLSVFVNNHFGVLTRISGLFARRGYNIKSLTVGETLDPKISRMTIEFFGDERTLSQIKSQLLKVEDVKSVEELEAKNSIFSELFLIKVEASDETRASILQFAEIFKARAVDVSRESIVFEITGGEDKLEAFLKLMKEYGVSEIARTGLTALSRSR